MNPFTYASRSVTKEDWLVTVVTGPLCWITSVQSLDLALESYKMDVIDSE